MKNKSDINTKFPLTIILGLILDVLFLVIFLYRMVLGEMLVLEGLMLLGGIIFIIHIAVCPYAGKIKISNNKINVDYFFIWNTNYECELNKITSFSISESVKYRSYSKIYLTLENNIHKTINIQTTEELLLKEKLEECLKK